MNPTGVPPEGDERSERGVLYPLFLGIVVEVSKLLLGTNTVFFHFGEVFRAVAYCVCCLVLGFDKFYPGTSM